MENITPVQSPGSLIEKEEKGCNIEDKFDQNDADSEYLHIICISRCISVWTIVRKRIEQLRERIEQLREKIVLRFEGLVGLRFFERMKLEVWLDELERVERQLERVEQLELERVELGVELVGVERVELVERAVERVVERVEQELEIVVELAERPAADASEVNTRNHWTLFSTEHMRVRLSPFALSKIHIIQEPVTVSGFCYTDEKVTDRMKKMRLLKQYGLLKEELNWPDIISVADDLYTDGHLKWHELKKIHDRSQPRRKAIDTLLKIVLENASSVSAFMKSMESKSTLSYIVKRINMTKVSEEEMKRFDHLQASLQGQRQNIYQVPSQKIRSSDSEYCFLPCHSDEKDVIDQMSDALLSKFFISISDHTGVVEQTHLDGKILALIGLMKKCPYDVYDVLAEVLTKNNMQHMLDGNQIPNMKRTHWSIDLDIPTLQKRAKFEVSASDAVEKIACSLRNAPAMQKLENEASKHLDLEMKEAFWGSMGLMFSFKAGMPSQKLKQAFA